MKLVLGILGGLVVLLVAGYVSDKQFFTTQVAFILIFALIMVVGWALLKFIQKS